MKRWRKRYGSIFRCGDRKTLCPTTAARQKEAEELSKKCSQMLVIGDKTSSNTAKLASVCKKYCKHVHYVSKESELSLEKSLIMI